jgi:hypothetical protein
MKSIQEQFDMLLENQDWYGLGFEAKVEALAGHFGGTFSVAAVRVAAVRRAIQRTKQKTALPRRTRNKAAAKVGRYTGPTLLNMTAAPAAATYAANLLRALGRKADVKTSLGEVYHMVEAAGGGLDPAFSFKSIAARAAWNALVNVVSA